MTVVARIIEMRQLGAGSAAAGMRASGPHPVVNPSVTGSTEIPVPAVVFHGKTSHRLFSIPAAGTPLELGDIIHTSSDTVLAIAFVIGGRVGVNANSIVRVDSERSVHNENLTLSYILRRQLGIWGKVATQSNPLLIQTNGGVMGVKG